MGGEREGEYYTVVRRYGKTIFYERAQQMSKMLFLAQENKIHIFMPLCNVLFVI